MIQSSHTTRGYTVTFPHCWLYPISFPMNILQLYHHFTIHFSQILGHFHTTPIFQLPFSDTTTEADAVLRAARCSVGAVWSWSWHRSEGWTAAAGKWTCGWLENPRWTLGKCGKHGWKCGIFIDKHWFIKWNMAVENMWQSWEIMENSTPKNGGVTWFITGNINYNQYNQYIYIYINGEVSSKPCLITSGFIHLWNRWRGGYN